jgi:hypothetical protein
VTASQLGKVTAILGDRGIGIGCKLESVAKFTEIAKARCEFAAGREWVGAGPPLSFLNDLGGASSRRCDIAPLKFGCMLCNWRDVFRTAVGRFPAPRQGRAMDPLLPLIVNLYFTPST